VAGGETCGGAEPWGSEGARRELERKKKRKKNTNLRENRWRQQDKRKEHRSGGQSEQNTKLNFKEQAGQGETEGGWDRGDGFTRKRLWEISYSKAKAERRWREGLVGKRTKEKKKKKTTGEY